MHFFLEFVQNVFFSNKKATQITKTNNGIQVDIMLATYMHLCTWITGFCCLCSMRAHVTERKHTHQTGWTQDQTTTTESVTLDTSTSSARLGERFPTMQRRFF